MAISSKYLFWTELIKYMDLLRIIAFQSKPMSNDEVARFRVTRTCTNMASTVANSELEIHCCQTNNKYIVYCGPIVMFKMYSCTKNDLTNNMHHMSSASFYYCCTMLNVHFGFSSMIIEYKSQSNLNSL